MTFRPFFLSFSLTFFFTYLRGCLYTIIILRGWSNTFFTFVEGNSLRSLSNPASPIPQRQRTIRQRISFSTIHEPIITSLFFFPSQNSAAYFIRSRNRSLLFLTVLLGIKSIFMYIVLFGWCFYLVVADTRSAFYCLPSFSFDHCISESVHDHS